MLVDIVSDGVGHFLLHLDECVVEVVELRILLKERHEVLVAAFAAELVAVLLEELAAFVDKFAELVSAPQTHGFGEGIEEDEGPISVVYELDEAAVHHFAPQDEVGQQGCLFSIEKLQRLGIHLASDGCKYAVVDESEEGICAAGSSLLQL